MDNYCKGLRKIDNWYMDHMLVEEEQEHNTLEQQHNTVEEGESIQVVGEDSTRVAVEEDNTQAVDDVIVREQVFQ